MMSRVGTDCGGSAEEISGKFGFIETRSRGLLDA